MVVTRKKLRSFKFTSIAQRWQDKVDRFEKSNTQKKVKKIVKKVKQKKSTNKIEEGKKRSREALTKTPFKQKQEKDKFAKLNILKTKKRNNQIAKRKQAVSEKMVTVWPEDSSRTSTDENIDLTVYKCTECEFTTSYLNQFTRHIKRKYLTCHKCDFHTDLRCVLHVHVSNCHGQKIKPNYEENLKIIAQKGPVYFCDFCTLIFKDRFEIVEHVKNVHKHLSMTNMYCCSCCNFETKLRSTIRLHYIQVHSMLSENVKYIADRSVKNDRIITAQSYRLEDKPIGRGKSISTEQLSPKTVNPRRKSMQEKKAEYLRTQVTTGTKNKSDTNIGGKENKKKQYIQTQLGHLKDSEQQKIWRKLKTKESESSEGSEKSYSGQSEKSDESDIDEIIKVFFQDKAIEISLKKSTSNNQKSPAAKRKCIEGEN